MKLWSFQERVGRWLYRCFAASIVEDRTERWRRFLEEALELCQAAGATPEEARSVVAYVFNRPVGKPGQEVGGVMVTLAALCHVYGIDLEGQAATELGRIELPDVMEKIRAKQNAKPEHIAVRAG